MASYNDTFKLSMQDIEMIEAALRKEISTLSDRLLVTAGTHEEGTIQTCGETIRKLHQLLGKLHNQKIWYGQVRQTGIPISG